MSHKCNDNNVGEGDYVDCFDCNYHEYNYDVYNTSDFLLFLSNMGIFCIETDNHHFSQTRSHLIKELDLQNYLFFIKYKGAYHFPKAHSLLIFDCDYKEQITSNLLNLLYTKFEKLKLLI